MVLPLLGDYLTSETHSTDTRPEIEEAEDVKLKFKKKGTSKKESATISRKSQSVEIQQRILALLGTMGGHNEAILASASLENDQHASAWDPVRRLKLKIGLADLVPFVQLDELLPRIVFLAESSPDRPTKVKEREEGEEVLNFFL